MTLCTQRRVRRGNALRPARAGFVGTCACCAVWWSGSGSGPRAEVEISCFGEGSSVGAPVDFGIGQPPARVPCTRPKEEALKLEENMPSIPQ